MKKIINGKLYDTEKAKELGRWANTGSWRDFNHMVETLYRKRTGEFFLHGAGGPMTKYAVSQGQNSWSGGEKIIPLSAAKAREWAEERLDADEYMELFGVPEENSDKRSMLCVQIPAALAAKIRMNAADAGKTLTAYIEELFNKALQ